MLKNLGLITLLSFSVNLVIGQEQTYPAKVSSGVYAWEAMPSKDNVKSFLRGNTTFLKNFEVEAITLEKGKSANQSAYISKLDELIIVKEGRLKITIDTIQKEVGAGSVAMIMTDDESNIVNVGEVPATYYSLRYKSNGTQELNSEEVSFILDKEELPMIRHSKGSRRDFFNQPTRQLEVFEMHTTALLPQIQSHPPHTHVATEILLIIRGNTEHHIDGINYRGREGDIIFLESNIPHAVKNVGDDICEYFAFQWRN